MKRDLRVFGLLCLFVLPVGAVAGSLEPVSGSERLDYIRSAQVWRATDIPHMDIWRGPKDSPRYEFEQEVKCDYIKKKGSGTTSKFECKTDDGKKIKVRYDAANGKLYAMPAASRLFWALGFGAVRSWPAKVLCHNCPEDPYANPFGEDIADRIFDPAVVDVKPRGERIALKDNKKSGWSWRELELVNRGHGGAPRAHVDALKLLAAFVQHGDNNAGQQALICLPGGIEQDDEGNSTCNRPFMFVEDLGSTFGGAEMLDEKASMNLDAWQNHKIWKDSSHCIADLAHSPDGTLTHPKISEEGRAFLARLLRQLTDRQIEDVFRVARADQRDQNEEGRDGHQKRTVPISEWVRVFKQKRDEIARTRCPS